MGVFSGARSEDFKAHQHPVTVRNRRVRATAGQVRDVWRAAPVAIDLSSPFEPVRGVSIELFADVLRGAVYLDDEHATGGALASAYGVKSADWLTACRTWNERISSVPEVSRRFRELYRQDVPLYVS